MDYASQWPQGIISGVVNNKPIVESTNSTAPSSSKEETLEKRVIRAQKGQQQEANINCPRCNSTNTKFCYYNNYSLSQPRYFCKTCRRYWTHGGSLRNVPVGGGSRKNRRSSSSPSSTSSSKNSIISTPPASSLIQANPQNPNPIQGHDLNLAYDSNPPPMLPQNPSFTSSDQLSLGNFIALNTVPPPGCSAGPISSVYPPGGLLSSLQGLKPTLHYFSLDNNNNWFGSGVSGSNNGSAQQRASGDDDGLIYEHDRSRQQGDHSSSGYSWNSSGMFGGGSWQL